MDIPRCTTHPRIGFLDGKKGLDAHSGKRIGIWAIERDLRDPAFGVRVSGRDTTPSFRSSWLSCPRHHGVNKALRCLVRGGESRSLVDTYSIPEAQDSEDLCHGDDSESTVDTISHAIEVGRRI